MVVVQFFNASDPAGSERRNLSLLFSTAASLLRENNPAAAWICFPHSLPIADTISVNECCGGGGGDGLDEPACGLDATSAGAAGGGDNLDDPDRGNDAATTAGGGGGDALDDLGRELDAATDDLDATELEDDGGGANPGGGPFINGLPFFFTFFFGIRRNACSACNRSNSIYIGVYNLLGNEKN